MQNCIVRYIKNSKYDILHNESVLFNGDEVELGLCVFEYDFSVVFRFIENDDKEQGLRLENIGENKLALVCINFEPLGAGTRAPVKIATIKEKEIYINFFSSMESEDVRKLEFSVSVNRGERYEK